MDDFNEEKLSKQTGVIILLASKTNVNNFSLKISDSLSNFNSLKIGRECAR